MGARVLASDCDNLAPTHATNQGCQTEERTDGIWASPTGGIRKSISPTALPELGERSETDNPQEALVWTSNEIKIYTWSHENAPDNILSDEIDIGSWDSVKKPSLYLASDIDMAFKGQRIMFNIAFCGNPAGRVFWTIPDHRGEPTCKDETQEDTCEAFVAGNPDEFSDVYFQIQDIRYFTEVKVASSSSAITTAAATSTPIASSILSPRESTPSLLDPDTHAGSGAPLTRRVRAAGLQNATDSSETGTTTVASSQTTTSDSNMPSNTTTPSSSPVPESSPGNNAVLAAKLLPTNATLPMNDTGARPPLARPESPAADEDKDDSISRVTRSSEMSPLDPVPKPKSPRGSNTTTASSVSEVPGSSSGNNTVSSATPQPTNTALPLNETAADLISSPIKLESSPPVAGKDNSSVLPTDKAGQGPISSPVKLESSAGKADTEDSIRGSNSSGISALKPSNASETPALSTIQPIYLNTTSSPDSERGPLATPVAPRSSGLGALNATAVAPASIAKAAKTSCSNRSAKATSTTMSAPGKASIVAAVADAAADAGRSEAELAAPGANLGGPAVLSSPSEKADSAVGDMAAVTVYKTTTAKVTACPPTVTSCGVGAVATVVVPWYVTVCPLTAVETRALATSTASPSGTKRVIAIVIKVYRITRCPSSVPNCPLGSQGTLSATRTYCDGRDCTPPASTSPPLLGGDLGKSSDAAASKLPPAGGSLVTYGPPDADSTMVASMVTRVSTITKCPPTVTSCSLGKVVTSVFLTGICSGAGCGSPTVSAKEPVVTGAQPGSSGGSFNSDALDHADTAPAPRVPSQAHPQRPEVDSTGGSSTSRHADSEGGRPHGPLGSSHSNNAPAPDAGAAKDHPTDAASYIGQTSRPSAARPSKESDQSREMPNDAPWVKSDNEPSPAETSREGLVETPEVSQDAGVLPPPDSHRPGALSPDELSTETPPPGAPAGGVAGPPRGSVSPAQPGDMEAPSPVLVNDAPKVGLRLGVLSAVLGMLALL